MICTLAKMFIFQIKVFKETISSKIWDKTFFVVIDPSQRLFKFKERNHSQLWGLGKEKKGWLC